ncbi:Octaprenyl diphosphate synthase / Dimethylallyltransferase / (2E,6E)-farnesyl diphosphate synthase / Geranylgeranyl diphosphate synthase [hydrothermal vent metagenome]|uniref:Octaprenyl diphosphate synthase / Dimethylallyltransferase / (2E,6E)-farnesyl diphosphate synthase / Geranylgeranyl diphosphate synthase n=1 Tax=hydrothermal vent metagenome TaxID=652676 RepID=A0A1W1BD25_9ZZZZ
MEAVEKELQRLIKEVGYKPVEELFSKLSGGKRLRAKLILKIAKESKESVLLAAIVELIHAASLLHDDVIDDAMLRRGKASVNATEGSKIAVMLGDILYSKAFSELVGFTEEIAKTIASSVTALSVGEMMDVDLAKSFNSNEKKYLKMLYLKTATLIEAAAASAALLAGKDKEKYSLYGKNLGLSFQIIDDILDIIADEKTLGKPAMNDYTEGKVTLPYIYLFESLDDEGKEKLISLHAKKLSKEDVEWIRLQMKKHHSIDKAYALASKLSEEAKEAIEGEAELTEILDKMIQRSY